jgi:general secretion pathway protein D
MNALMVISKQPRYIEEARQWIARLDRTRNAQGRRLFVYYAQNGKASELAQTLIGVFQPGRIVQARAPLTPLRPGAREQAAPEAAPQDGAAAPNPAQPNAAEADAPRIMADEANNAVLVMATPAEYETIEEVLAKLDLQPLQVLIEATIIEVTLRDQLRFGVQYFIKSGGLGITDTGTTVLSAVNSALIQPAFPGFAFTLADTNQARFIIDTLSELTELNVISSPQVMALNNQTARLQVGDQVPIVVQTSASTFTADTRIVNAIEYRDTGVTLDVTPRDNAAGLVTLDISQEVSDVVPTTTSNIDSPTIQQRKIVSTVAVQSGQMVVLGGLIRESNRGGRSGIPGLVDLPLIGVLFGQSTSDLQRTELLVMITPTVLRNEREASDLTGEIRRKYHALMELEQDGIRQPRRLKQKWPWSTD